jgi:ubiquinone/menaquinone biosynthesis C-methylase UbiE
VVSQAGVTDRVRLRVGDAHELPFESNNFDFAIALGVLPYLHTPGVALSEMARVLKPRGHIVVSSDNLLRLNHVLDPRYTPVLAPLRQVVKEVLVRLGHPPRALQARRLTSNSLRRLMGDAGLDVVNRQTLGFGPFSFLGWQLIPDQLGLRLHRRLQLAADRGVPILAAAGAQVLVLARRGPASAVSS